MLFKPQLILVVRLLYTSCNFLDEASVECNASSVKGGGGGRNIRIKFNEMCLSGTFDWSVGV